MTISSDPYEPLNSTINKLKTTYKIMHARLHNGALSRTPEETNEALSHMHQAISHTQAAIQLLFPDA